MFSQPLGLMLTFPLEHPNADPAREPVQAAAALAEQPERTGKVDDEPSDIEVMRLMARVQRGDVHAFEEIVQRFWNRTFVFARYLTKDADEAFDVTQESFARLWERHADWRPSGSVRTWLLRTAQNCVISEYRRQKVRERWVQGRMAEEVQRPLSPLEETESRATMDEIHRAVTALSPRRREAFVLFHLQGLSYREAAEVMSVRPQTIANYLQAALDDLRVALGHISPFSGSKHAPEESTEREPE